MTAGTELPAYLPYPRFLLETDISHTARVLYSLLLDRSTLSQKNGWRGTDIHCLPHSGNGGSDEKRQHHHKGRTERTGRCGAGRAQAGGLFLCQPPLCESCTRISRCRISRPMCSAILSARIWQVPVWILKICSILWDTLM